MFGRSCWYILLIIYNFSLLLFSAKYSFSDCQGSTGNPHMFTKPSAGKSVVVIFTNIYFNWFVEKTRECSNVDDRPSPCELLPAAMSNLIPNFIIHPHNFNQWCNKNPFGLSMNQKKSLLKLFSTRWMNHYVPASNQRFIMFIVSVSWDFILDCCVANLIRGHCYNDNAYTTGSLNNLQYFSKLF